MRYTIQPITPYFVDDQGTRYHVHVYGEERPDGLWEGSLGFVPEGGGTMLHTGAETEQSSRADLEYWASGLTEVYLEGALARARGTQ